MIKKLLLSLTFILIILTGCGSQDQKQTINASPELVYDSTSKPWTNEQVQTADAWMKENTDEVKYHTGVIVAERYDSDDGTFSLIIEGRDYQIHGATCRGSDDELDTLKVDVGDYIIWDGILAKDTGYWCESQDLRVLVKSVF